MSEANLAPPSPRDTGGPAASAPINGRPAVLILFGAQADEKAAAIIGTFATAAEAFETRGASVICVTEGRPAVAPHGLTVASDPALMARCGVGPGDVLVLLHDRRGRAMLALEPEDEADSVAACLGCLDRLGGRQAIDPVPLLRVMAEPLAAGLKAPVCFGMTADRRFYSSEEQYGRPALMILAGAAADVRPVLGALEQMLPRFLARGADALLVTQGNPARLIGAVPAPVRIIDGGDFLLRCGVSADQVTLMLLDRNQRIMQTLPNGDPAGALADCLGCLEALPTEAARDVLAPAPAIVLPRLLPPDMCRYLIEQFDSVPTADSGVARVDAEGRAGNVLDLAKKRRRDMRVEPGTKLHAAVRDAIVRRCRPEIAKAFQCEVGFTDRILVACYDSSGGWFRRHRDNESEQVAFRQFALSLNLNTGAYEGGCLMFPEYNDHLYSPPAGGGVIFSASVLHEVTPVTAGRRYVLLTFLHGEAAEARRLAWEARAGG